MFSHSIPKTVAIKMRSQLKKSGKVSKYSKSSISKENIVAEKSAEVKIISEINAVGPKIDDKANRECEIKSIVEKKIDIEISKDENIDKIIEKSPPKTASEIAHEAIETEPSDKTLFDELSEKNKHEPISDFTKEIGETKSSDEVVIEEDTEFIEHDLISEFTEELIKIDSSEKSEPEISPEFSKESVETKPLDKTVTDETASEQPAIEEFDKLVLREKLVKESKSAIVKRSRTLTNETKEELRKKDLKKYSSSNSLTDIKTNDDLISKLIDRYNMLENKYSRNFPLSMIDVSKEEFNAIVLYVREYIENKYAVTLLSGFISTLFLVKTVENYGIKGDFWRSVSTLLNYSETEVTSFLKEAMLSFCSSERLYFHYYDNIHSYTGTILIHAVIGADDLDNTLDFLRNFYIEEMYETYSKETVSDHISNFIDIMAADTENDIKESGDFSGIYKVSFNLKNACRIFPEAMVDILKCLLFNINAYYHRLSDVSYSPTVFYKYYKRWCINDIHRARTFLAKKNNVRQRNVIKSTLKQVEKLSANNKCSYFID